MGLRDLLATDIQDIVLNTSDLAEEVTYTPKGGAGITINVLPFRAAAPDSREEGRNMQFRSARVRVANHATLGIVTPKEGDTIAMVIRAGQSSQTVRVSAIISTTTASHILEVTA